MSAAVPLFAVAGTALQLMADAEESAGKVRELGENKKLAEEAAADAVARGALDAGRQRLLGSQLISRQKVAFAAAGVDPTVGTPLDVMMDTRAMSEHEARTLENNAWREALGFKKQGAKFGEQAEREKRRQGFRAVGTFLGGGGRVAGAVADAWDWEQK